MLMVSIGSIWMATARPIGPPRTAQRRSIITGRAVRQAKSRSSREAAAAHERLPAKGFDGSRFADIFLTVGSRASAIRTPQERRAREVQFGVRSIPPRWAGEPLAFSPAGRARRRGAAGDGKPRLPIPGLAGRSAGLPPLHRPP